MNNNSPPYKKVIVILRNIYKIPSSRISDEQVVGIISSMNENQNGSTKNILELIFQQHGINYSTDYNSFNINKEKAYKNFIKILRENFEVRYNDISDDEIKDLVFSNNRTKSITPEVFDKLIKIIIILRHTYEIPSTRISNNDIKDIVLKNNKNFSSMEIQDLITYLFTQHGINYDSDYHKFRKEINSTNGGGYKPKKVKKKVKKTVTRIISGKKRVIHTGSKGGKYFIRNKKKVYI